MLILHFEGWFQCRLATDPDPSDEPRGVSGYTFAVAGEPDLDRIIRLQRAQPGTLRSHGPEIGVFVRRVSKGRKRSGDDHPLIGARVDLLDDPVFESRNYVVAAAGAETIDPFHLRIAGQGVTLTAKDFVDPRRPELRAWQVSPKKVHRRAGDGGSAFSQEVAHATGIGTDYVGNRRKRLELLRKGRPDETDPVRKAALEKRIRELKYAVDHPNDRRCIALGGQLNFRFSINGPARVDPPRHRRLLGGTIDKTKRWRIRFWMGAWDADALSGYLKGALSVPLKGN